MHEESAKVVKKIKTAIKNRILEKQSVRSLVDEALKAGVITTEEKNLMEKAYSIKESVVQVDGFLVEEYLKRGL